MPNSLNEWVFWIFSTIVVGGLLGIVVNLLSPNVRQSGSSFFQRQRFKKQKYLDQIMRLSIMLDRDPATVFLHYASNLIKHLMMLSFGIIALLLAGALFFVIFAVDTVLIRVLVFAIWITLALGGLILWAYHFFMFLETASQLVDLNRIHSKRKQDEQIEVEVIESP